MKQQLENGDEIEAYESDDGDSESREIDYTSDPGWDSK
jgi:hypothetical protein